MHGAPEVLRTLADRFDATASIQLRGNNLWNTSELPAATVHR